MSVESDLAKFKAWIAQISDRVRRLETGTTATRPAERFLPTGGGGGGGADFIGGPYPFSVLAPQPHILFTDEAQVVPVPPGAFPAGPASEGVTVIGPGAKYELTKPAGITGAAYIRQFSKTVYQLQGSLTIPAAALPAADYTPVQLATNWPFTYGALGHGIVRGPHDSNQRLHAAQLNSAPGDGLTIAANWSDITAGTAAIALLDGVFLSDLAW